MTIAHLVIFYSQLYHRRDAHPCSTTEPVAGTDYHPGWTPASCSTLSVKLLYHRRDAHLCSNYWACSWDWLPSRLDTSKLLDSHC